MHEVVCRVLSDESMSDDLSPKSSFHYTAIHGKLLQLFKIKLNNNQSFVKIGNELLTLDIKEDFLRGYSLLGDFFNTMLSNKIRDRTFGGVRRTSLHYSPR